MSTYACGCRMPMHDIGRQQQHVLNCMHITANRFIGCQTMMNGCHHFEK